MLLAVPAVAAAASEEFDPSSGVRARPVHQHRARAARPVDQQGGHLPPAGGGHLHRGRDPRGARRPAAAAHAAPRTWSSWPTSSSSARSPARPCPRASSRATSRTSRRCSCSWRSATSSASSRCRSRHESGTCPFGIPDLGPLRRDGEHQRHPRADPRDVHRLQLRGHPGARAGRVREDAGPGRAPADQAVHRGAGGAVPAAAPRQPLGPALRQPARRPPADHHVRRLRGPARQLRRAASPSRSACSSTSSSGC